MSTWLDLLQSPCTQRLGWTLVHFLWQGALLAALFAAARAFLRSANTRYLAGYATLCLMVLVMTLTFSAQNTEPIAPVATLGKGQSVEAREPMAVDTINVTATAVRTPASQPGLLERLRQMSGRLERMFPWLVAGWMLGVWLLSLRLVAGWLQVRSLKPTPTSRPASHGWKS